MTHIVEIPICYMLYDAYKFERMGKHDIQTFYSGEYDQALKLISFPSWCFFFISFSNLISIFNINLQRVAVITIIILLPDVVLPVTSALNLPVSLK